MSSGFTYRTPIAPYNIAGGNNTMQRSRIDYINYADHLGAAATPKLSLVLGPINNPMTHVATEAARLMSNSQLV